MPIPIPRSFVELIILGPISDRRLLQDSPILGDVWIAFAAEPEAPQELLITPYKENSAVAVAVQIDSLVERDRRTHPRDRTDLAEIAPLQGIIAACLGFEEMIRVVIPMTSWWKTRFTSDEMRNLLGSNAIDFLTERVWIASQMLNEFNAARQIRFDNRPLSALDRFIVLSALILWGSTASLSQPMPDPDESLISGAIAENIGKIATGMATLLEQLRDPIERPKAVGTPLVYQISLNRPVSMALDRSVGAVKADAAKNLFKVDCSKIAWAVLDSGIQGDHAAFHDKNKASRVKASFDFSRYRRIVSLDNQRIFGGEGNATVQRLRLNDLLGRSDLKNPPNRYEAKRMLRQLSVDLIAKRPVDFRLVRPFIDIKSETPPVNNHGTHVAGIIGANGDAYDTIHGNDPGTSPNGMCPDIAIYDFRVISNNLKDTEFNVIAALQFIRYLNERGGYVTIHGANLSLSIPHDVRNYACGRTPICVEAERLVESGVVVVAAAGNLGYQSFTTREGSYESYAAFSVTDPGNAEGVITVGSTHRSSPHTYGVSYFSSRGPTGDGRSKPDLVAPGERIQSTFALGWGDLDGTSMAAPHVSGAAAMLLARYSELIGRPRRIKSVLCESATDLGRERSFQGSGMLDVLRAFQKL